MKFKFLMTDRLNQDCLENLFSKIRGHTGGVYNPTASAFRAILRQVMVDQIFYHSDGSNCQADTSKFLLNLGAMKSAVNASLSQAPEVDLPVEPMNEQFAELLLIASPLPLPKDPHAKAAEDNVLMYIAGYIAKKLELKVCSPCRELLTGSYSGKATELFIAHKQFKDLTGKGLQVPTSELFNAVQSLQTEYVACVGKILPGDNVKARLVKSLSKSFDQNLFSHCDTRKHIIDKYIMSGCMQHSKTSPRPTRKKVKKETRNQC
jgi:hypothetical protein